LWIIFALLDPDPDPATQINGGSMRIRIQIVILILGFWRLYHIVSWIPRCDYTVLKWRKFFLPAELPPLNISLGKREHRPNTEMEILKSVSISIFKISKQFQRSK
jgi:hypothetical protein